MGTGTTGADGAETALTAVVAVGLLAAVYKLFAVAGPLFVGSSTAQAVAVAVPVGLALAGFARGARAGIPTAITVTAYLAAIVTVTGVFLSVVWLSVVVLVGLPVGAELAVTAANTLTLVLGGVATLGVVGALLDGDASTSWALNLRMVAAIVLLLLCTLVFLAFVWLLVFVPALFVFPPVIALYIGAAAALATVALAAYLEAGHATAIEQRADATPVDREAYPELYDRVTRIAAQLDVPVPTIAISEREAPEAMVVGFRPSSAHLVLSTGTIEALSGEELDAVIAHELAHIANRDAMVMTAVSTPVVIVDGIRARLIGSVSGGESTYNGISEQELWGENQEWRITDPGLLESPAGQKRAGLLGWFLGVMAVWTWFALQSPEGEPDEDTMVIKLVVGVAITGLLVTWLVSRVVVAVFSRARETVADRTAAEVTGSPASLASALRALDEQIDDAPTEDLREVSSVSSLSILPLERGVLADTHRGVPDAPKIVQRIKQKLFGTHPPTESRLRTLERLEAEQENRDDGSP